MHPTVPMIADFLTYLFEHEKLKPKVIEGVKSCLSQAFNLCGVLDITHNIHLAALIRNFTIECPAARFDVPKWNLNLVLQMLLSDPFEPIYEIDLKHLTYKTVFLLTLGSGARSSEIHSLTHSGLSHSENWSEIWLRPSLDFLAKNQVSRDQKHRRKFCIPSLTHFTGHDLPDRKLCPVRALRMYLHKTATRRSVQKQKRLFISLNPSRHQEISKSAISLWLRSTIKMAHSSCTDHQAQMVSANPHEIRKVASSLAYDRSMSLHQILENCTWRSHSTFTSFYLKDLSEHFPDHMALKPCVAAGMLIKH